MTLPFSWLICLPLTGSSGITLNTCNLSQRERGHLTNYVSGYWRVHLAEKLENQLKDFKDQSKVFIARAWVLIYSLCSFTGGTWRLQLWMLITVHHGTRSVSLVHESILNQFSLYLWTSVRAPKLCLSRFISSFLTELTEICITNQNKIQHGGTYQLTEINRMKNLIRLWLVHHSQGFASNFNICTNKPW